MKNLVNAVKKALKGKIKKTDFTYQIDDEKDISTETAKKFLIESINVSEIMKKCDADNLDKSQKVFVLESLKDIILQIEDIET